MCSVAWIVFVPPCGAGIFLSRPVSGTQMRELGCSAVLPGRHRDLPSAFAWALAFGRRNHRRANPTTRPDVPHGCSQHSCTIQVLESRHQTGKDELILTGLDKLDDPQPDRLREA